MAYTLEMPFKDSDLNPDLMIGWNGERSMDLGKSVLIVLNQSSEKGLF